MPNTSYIIGSGQGVGHPLETVNQFELHVVVCYR